MSWIEELWRSVLEGTVPQATRAPEWAEYPALGRLTITRPELLRPFAEHNRRHPDQAVRPHSFVSVAYQKPFARAEKLRLFAPYVAPAQALEVPWYELRSGQQVRITVADSGGVVDPNIVPVRSYGEIVRAYADRPESKFLASGGGPCLKDSSGTLLRQRIEADKAEYIGKEGNLLDRRVEGPNLSSEVLALYEDPGDFERLVIPSLRGRPRADIAAAAGISERAVRDLLALRRKPRKAHREALGRLAAVLTMEPK